MTDTERAVFQFLADRLPDYAQHRLIPETGEIDWSMLADNPMLSGGEKAVVTLAAHLGDRTFVVKQDPRTLRSLLGSVDWSTRKAWAEACVVMEREMVR